MADSFYFLKLLYPVNEYTCSIVEQPSPCGGILVPLLGARNPDNIMCIVYEKLRIRNDWESEGGTCARDMRKLDE